MTLVTFMGLYMGMPKMDAAAMLSKMMSIPVFMGWIMHFMIGMNFAIMYVILLGV